MEKSFLPRELTEILDSIQNLVGKNWAFYGGIFKRLDDLKNQYSHSLPEEQRPIKNSKHYELFVTGSQSSTDLVIFDLIKKIKDILSKISLSYSIKTTDLLKVKNDLNKIFDEYTKIFDNIKLEPNPSNPLESYQKFSDEVSLTITQTRETIDSTKVILGEVLQSVSQILKIQEDYSKQIDPVFEGYQKKFDDLFKDFQEKNEIVNLKFDSDSTQELKELYLNIAKSEEAKADKYRFYALIIFTFVGILIFALILGSTAQSIAHLIKPHTYNELEFGISYLVRIVGLLSITLPAWYLTKESSRHRLVSYKARILGTELRAFPHYVKELSNDERNELRVKLIDKFFGQELYSENNKSDSPDLNEQTKATTEALKLVTAALKLKP